MTVPQISVCDLMCMGTVLALSAAVGGPIILPACTFAPSNGVGALRTPPVCMQIIPSRLLVLADGWLRSHLRHSLYYTDIL